MAPGSGDKRVGRRPKAAGITHAIGGMLVGFDEQIMRSTPRAEILVKRGTQLRGERAGGGDLILELPEDRAVRIAAERVETEER
jgi:hypothetical protein